MLAIGEAEYRLGPTTARQFKPLQGAFSNDVPCTAAVNEDRAWFSVNRPTVAAVGAAPKGYRAYRYAHGGLRYSGSTVYIGIYWALGTIMRRRATLPASSTLSIPVPSMPRVLQVAALHRRVVARSPSSSAAPPRFVASVATSSWSKVFARQRIYALLRRRDGRRSCGAAGEEGLEQVGRRQQV